MNLAKISANGQITVPVEIRRKLNLKEGDKILFIESPTGQIIIDNASATAIIKAQQAFVGAAQAAGLKDEEDVQKLVDEIRLKGIISTKAVVQIPGCSRGDKP